jgi:cephalosporin hydroxylase
MAGVSEEEQAIVDAFHKLYYESNLWWRVRWLGSAVLKCPFDLMVYQEIIYDQCPDLIIETGTYLGGSTLFFASMCKMVNHGRVISIDIEPKNQPRNRRVKYLTGSTLDPAIIARVAKEARGKRKVMVVLDSDHHRDHVLAEMRTYGRFVTPGCYMVVEDTNINGHPVEPDFGPGPAEAVEAFLAENDEFEVDHECEKLRLTWNKGGWLRKKAKGETAPRP